MFQYFRRTRKCRSTVFDGYPKRTEGNRGNREFSFSLLSLLPSVRFRPSEPESCPVVCSCLCGLTKLMIPLPILENSSDDLIQRRVLDTQVDDGVMVEDSGDGFGHALALDL